MDENESEIEGNEFMWEWDGCSIVNKSSLKENDWNIFNFKSFNSFSFILTHLMLLICLIFF